MKGFLMVSGLVCIVAAAVLVATAFSSRAATERLAFPGVIGRVVSTVTDPQQTADAAHRSRSTFAVLPPDAAALVRPAKQSVMSRALDRGQSLDLAIREGIARYGKSDGRVAALTHRADAVCSEDPDPYRSVDARYVDATRAWAIERTLDLCQGFDRKNFSLDPPRAHSASAALKRLGEQAATAAANRTIADGWDRTMLAEAGIFLLSTHRFPFAEVAPGADRQFGLVELESAWFMASDLALCGQMGGCGGTSLLVAEYCGRNGCTPGSDLLQAYRRNLPDGQFRLVLAFASWIQRQRVPVPD